MTTTTTTIRSEAAILLAIREAKILRAIREDAAYTGNQWASIGAIRDESGLSRADFDQAMTSLALAFAVVLIPEENQQTLTAADRSNGLALGGEVKHLVCLA